MVVLVVLHELAGLGIPDFGSLRKYPKDIRNVKVNDYSDISQEEWNNLKSQRLI